MAARQITNTSILSSDMYLLVVADTYVNLLPRTFYYLKLCILTIQHIFANNYLSALAHESNTRHLKLLID